MDRNQIKTYLSNVKLPQVPQEKNVKLTKAITVKEIEKQIQGLKAGKSPGDDGFTNEFYKKFKGQIISLLFKAYNYALDTGKWAQTILFNNSHS